MNESQLLSSKIGIFNCFINWFINSAWSGDFSICWTSVIADTNGTPHHPPQLVFWKKYSCVVLKEGA